MKLASRDFLFFFLIHFGFLYFSETHSPTHCCDFDMPPLYRDYKRVADAGVVS